MAKHKITIFFIVLFMLFITAPSIILVIDDSADVSRFYSISEEEEIGHTKLLVISDYMSSDEMTSSSSTLSHFYFSKEYSKPHLNIIFPPPELL